MPSWQIKFAWQLTAIVALTVLAALFAAPAAAQHAETGAEDFYRPEKQELQRLNCGQTITADGVVAGQWASGCDSEVDGRGYARYYTFTLAQQSDVAIALESGDADAYLYLRDGAARSGAARHEVDDSAGAGTNSRIAANALPAGTYTVEATTYASGQTGDFTLTVTGLSGVTTPAPTPGPDLIVQSASVSDSAPDAGAPFTLSATVFNQGGAASAATTLRYYRSTDATITSCDTQVGTDPVTGLSGTSPALTAAGPITADVVVAGQWASGCDSEVGGRGYARYYAFTLAQQSDVTIALESDDADAYLYLRDGAARSGAARHEDHDGGAGTNSRIVANALPAGTYTVEATTYASGATGDFTLTLTRLVRTSICGQRLAADGAVAGRWASGCHSEVGGRGYARYYTFTLAQQSDVTIALESDDADAYPYLRNGVARFGPARHAVDDIVGAGTNSRIVANALPAGTHTVEATTYASGETGDFTLTVTGLTGLSGVTTPLRPSSAESISLTAPSSAGTYYYGACVDTFAGEANVDNNCSGAVEVTAPSTPATDRAALVALYNAAGGASWTQQGNWLSSEPIGEWSGVTTGSDGRVTGLRLASRNLSGAIPPELGNLTSLTELWLSDNQLTGAIPTELGDLDNLTTIRLSGNQLTGCVPAGLRDVSGNDFTQLGLPFCASPDRAALVALYNATGGPSWTHRNKWLSAAPIGEWSGVTTGSDGRVTGLRLATRNLSGPIPPELGSLASLTALAMAGNDLTGAIPPELGSLASLTALLLNNNELSGPIPPELGSLTSLTALYLQENDLTGAIPPELGDLDNLTHILLAENQLTGCVPAGLQDVGLNDFTQLGLPFCASPDRAALVALYNATGGPSWTHRNKWLSAAPIGEWSGVTTGSDGRVTGLRLATRNLSGPIPPELGSLASLTALLLNNNELSGPIPPELGSLASLTSLYLSNNDLSGAIPTELGDLDNLDYIHLAGNQLTGCVPAGLQDVGINDFTQLALPFCGGPDLVVQSPSVTDSTPKVGAFFTLSVTVRNQGNAASTATTLRYYSSGNSTISSGDDEVGTADSVGVLAASASDTTLSVTLPAPTTPGTYYGACVVTFAGESNADNNCSSAVAVTAP